MRQPRDYTRTATMTCTYEGPSMANNLPTSAVPNNPLEENPLSRPSVLGSVEMLCQENSVGCRCTDSALAPPSSRVSFSLTSTTAAIWIFSEVRDTMRSRDCVTQGRVPSSREDRSSSSGRTKRFATTDAWHSPPYRALVQRARSCCGRCTSTGLLRLERRYA